MLKSKVQKYLEILMVGLFVLGFFASDNTRHMFWAFVAGGGAGIIIAEWVSRLVFTNKGIFIQKVFDSRTDEIPPEIKAKMDEITEMLKKSGKLSKDATMGATIVNSDEDKKCNDPHCPACYGFGDK